jgi:hypothetical protein
MSAAIFSNMNLEKYCATLQIVHIERFIQFGQQMSERDTSNNWYSFIFAVPASFVCCLVFLHEIDGAALNECPISLNLHLCHVAGMKRHFLGVSASM